MRKAMKKILLVAVMAVMAALPLALTACSKDIQLDEFDTLTVATNAEFKPFESKDESGNYVGFDMDLIREIGKRMDKKVEIVNMEFDAVVSAINSGTQLVGIAALTINPERKESVSFTEPYYSDAYQVVVVKDTNTAFDGLTTKEEVIAKLQGAKINVAKGQVGQAFAKGNDSFGFSGIKDAKVTIYKNVNLAITGITNESVALSDNAAAADFVAENKGYKIIDIELTKEYYGIAVKKSNKTLLNAIDKALKEIKEDGTFDQIISKYAELSK